MTQCPEVASLASPAGVARSSLTFAWYDCVGRALSGGVRAAGRQRLGGFHGRVLLVARCVQQQTLAGGRESGWPPACVSKLQ